MSKTKQKDTKEDKKEDLTELLITMPPVPTRIKWVRKECDFIQKTLLDEMKCLQNHIKKENADNETILSHLFNTNLFLLDMVQLIAVAFHRETHTIDSFKSLDKFLNRLSKVDSEFRKNKKRWNYIDGKIEERLRNDGKMKKEQIRIQDEQMQHDQRCAHLYG